MDLKNERELEVTRAKLQMLEESFRAAQNDTDADSHIRELELRSLKSLINQLKEEIARFEGRRVALSTKS